VGKARALGLGAISIGIIGLLCIAILQPYIIDTAFAAVTLHEFGHSFGLTHCPNEYCIMNREHTPLSYIKKLSYGLEYCPKCKGEILGHGRRSGEVNGLIVAYRCSGNPERITETVQEKLAFIPVHVDWFQIPNDEKVRTGLYGEVVMQDVFRVLKKYGIDTSKYQNPFKMGYLICEVNDPPSMTVDRWGISGTIMYAYPPVKFYIWGAALMFLLLIVVGSLVYLTESAFARGLPRR